MIKKFLTDNDQVIDLEYVIAIEVQTVCNAFIVEYTFINGKVIKSIHMDAELASKEKWAAFKLMTE
ncbi:hypothetical protein [Photobacterium leiognathi]|uniref:hypothetical protein n=1 Tax=Photobacterium leiognathi TaxID=553611 RepID=UPI003AF3B8F2